MEVVEVVVTLEMLPLKQVDQVVVVCQVLLLEVLLETLLLLILHKVIMEEMVKEVVVMLALVEVEQQL